jgi:hypothetical protein
MYTHCVVFSLSSEAETGAGVAALRADPSLGSAVVGTVGARTRNELLLAANMLDQFDMFWTECEEESTCGCFSYLYQCTIR